jgi:cell division protein FtsQ
MSVHGVSVEGNVALSAEALRGVAGLDGESLVRPDFDAARERLLTLPMVKAADVGRDWPFGAHITVVERQPWGVWQAGAQRVGIDDEGVVLDLPPPEGAPAIVQTDAAPLLVPGNRVDFGAVAVARELVASAEQTIGRPVVALEYSQASGLTAVLQGDLRVSFGDAQGYQFKLAALFAVLERAQEQGQAVHRVDLRFGDRVAVQ